MNKLTAIGWTGSMIVYLNISREVAIERYTKTSDFTPTNSMVTEFYFDDEFDAYEVSPKEGTDAVSF